MSRELDNLVKISQIKAEPGTMTEFEGLVNSARKRLADAALSNVGWAESALTNVLPMLPVLNGLR